MISMARVLARLEDQRLLGADRLSMGGEDHEPTFAAGFPGAPTDPPRVLGAIVECASIDGRGRPDVSPS